MNNINFRLGEGKTRDRFLEMMSLRLDHLAIKKEELTLAKVEPFKIELSNHEPSFEKPQRYNKKLMEFIDKEI